MRKVGTRKSTAKILHPDDPEIWVTVRRMPMAEALDFFGDVNSKGTVVAVQGPDGAVLRDKQGIPEVHVKSAFNSGTVISFLAKVVTGFGGIVDENGEPIQFSRETIPCLLDEALEVTDTEAEDDTKPFWRFIMDEVTKRETFDQDPKASA